MYALFSFKHMRTIWEEGVDFRGASARPTFRGIFDGFGHVLVMGTCWWRCSVVSVAGMLAEQPGPPFPCRRTEAAHWGFKFASRRSDSQAFIFRRRRARHAEPGPASSR